MKRYLLATLLIFSPVTAFGTSVAYYIIENVGGTHYITAPWGTWTGYIATPPGVMQPPNTYAHFLEFEFESPDYFVGGPTHWAIGIRGDGVTDTDGDGVPNLRGRGVIIGNVTGYPNWSGPCGPTPYPDTTAIESYWEDGNCVFGETTYGPALQNNVRYKIRIECANLSFRSAQKIKYTLWKQVGTNWVQLTSHAIADPYWFEAPSTLGGWFIGETSRNSSIGNDWTMYLYNVHEWWQ